MEGKWKGGGGRGGREGEVSPSSSRTVARRAHTTTQRAGSFGSGYMGERGGWGRERERGERARAREGQRERESEGERERRERERESEHRISLVRHLWALSPLFLSLRYPPSLPIRSLSLLSRSCTRSPPPTHTHTTTALPAPPSLSLAALAFSHPPPSRWGSPPRLAARRSLAQGCTQAHTHTHTHTH